MPSDPTTPFETMTSTPETLTSTLPTELSISALLANTDAAENKDHAYIMAFTCNLYNDAMKRLTGRSLWSAHDAMRVAKIMNIIMELNVGKRMESEIAEAVGSPRRPTR